MTDSGEIIKERLRLVQSLLDAVPDVLHPQDTERLGEISKRVQDLIFELTLADPYQAESALSALLDILGPQLDELQDIFVSGRYESFPKWLSDVEFQFADMLEWSKENIPAERVGQFAEIEAEQVLDQAIRSWRNDARLREVVSEARAALARVNDQAKEAHEALEDARESANLAAGAAGEAGESALGVFFKEYADRELRSANAFRIATIILLGASLVAAILYALGPFSLERAISHAVQVLAAAGIATFLGSQANGHRRTGNWARAIEVQLKSFPAFIAPIRASEVAERLYETIGRRVLGSPPKSREAASLDPALVAQLAATLGGGKH